MRNPGGVYSSEIADDYWERDSRRLLGEFVLVL